MLCEPTKAGFLPVKYWITIVKPSATGRAPILKIFNFEFPAFSEANSWFETIKKQLSPKPLLIDTYSDTFSKGVFTSSFERLFSEKIRII